MNEDPTTTIVRIHPYNKARRHLVRRYVYDGRRYEEGFLGNGQPRWYVVDAALGEKLGKLLAFPNEPDGPTIFEVSTIGDEIKRKKRVAAEALKKREEDVTEIEVAEAVDLDAVARSMEGRGDLTSEEVSGKPTKPAAPRTRAQRQRGLV